MKLSRTGWYLLYLAPALSAPAGAVASDVIDKADKIECFQHGKLVYSSSQKIREFISSKDFKLLAQLNIGPISDTVTSFYTDQSGNFVCIITSRN